MNEHENPNQYNSTIIRSKSISFLWRTRHAGKAVVVKGDHQGSGPQAEAIGVKVHGKLLA